MEIIIFGSLMVGILVAYILGKSIIEYRLIMKIKRREDELARMGVYPSGSSISHGMYVNKKYRRGYT